MQNRSSKAAGRILGLAVVTTMATGFAAYADIWSNPITNGNPSATNPFTDGQTVDPGITVSGIGATGVGANAGSNRFNFVNWSGTSGKYFYWILTPNAGKSIDFTSLTGNDQASNTGPSAFSLQYSINGGAFVQVAAGAITHNGSAHGLNNATPGGFDLSAPALDNVTQPIEFRLFAQNGATTGTYSINDFSFNGGVNDAPTGGSNNSSISADVTSVSLGRAIVGSSLSTKNANLNKSGTDATTYNISTGGQATASPTGDQNFAGGSQSQQVQIGISDISSVGPKTGTVTIHNTAGTIAAAGQGSVDSDDVINVSATIVDHAQPKVGPAEHPQQVTIDLGIRALNSTPATVAGAVTNGSSAADAIAGLDVDSVSGAGDTTKASINLASFTNLAAGGTQAFNASLNTSSIGQFASEYTITTSDEDIPGATGLSGLTVNVTGRVAMGGDCNLDNIVNALDFNAVAANFGTGTAWTDGDFDRSGVVDAADFTLLSANFGATLPAPALGTLVPEPASFAMIALGGLLLTRKRRSNA